MEGEPGETAAQTTGPKVDHRQVIEIMEQAEKHLHEHIYALEQGISELRHRVRLMENAREREFIAELGRRLDLTRSTDLNPALPSECGEETPGSRLRRARGL